MDEQPEKGKIWRIIEFIIKLSLEGIIDGASRQVD